MPSKQVVDAFLSQSHIAFVGVSRDPKQFANGVYRALRDDGNGRMLYPVNASADGAPLEGDRSYASLADVPDPVDGVVVMVAADKAAEVVREAIARGISRVWLQKGFGPSSVSDEAVRLCRENNVEVVDGACPLMWNEPVKGGHRVHRVFARHRFAA